tara:strand:+ start:107 stop:781 length:675 start_codon:yes stop_codon:yes gene_type:complete
MANPYFRNIPDFEYINRTEEGKNLTDFTKVKNLFKKGKFREDIYQELTTFEKYQIQGDDRPDNVAFELYGDSTLDWVVLMTNNILNIQTEWPMKQADFNEYLLEKYGSYDTLYTDIHHYESNEVKDSQGIIIYPKGVRVGAAQSVSYFDFYKDLQIDIVNISRPVTNYQYEEKLNNDKRNIFILKPKYLNVIFDDLEELMTYKEGSTQYVSETLKRADNVRLYD